MDTDEQLIESIFSEAAEHSDPDRRCAFLDGACRGDARLRDRVEALLQANDEAGSFLQEPALGDGPTIETLTERAGTRIGPYKLLQRIGEGGFGAVYMAEHSNKVRGCGIGVSAWVCSQPTSPQAHKPTPHMAQDT